MRWEAAYDGKPGTSAAARALAADFLARTRAEGVPVSERAEQRVLLVISELVGNVSKYAPGPCVVDLRSVAGTVEVVVQDTSSMVPVPRPRDPGRIGGHGLEIVHALAEHVEVTRHGPGKRIRARLALT